VPSIFVAAFALNQTTAGSTLTSLGIAAGNTLETILGTYLVERFAGPGFRCPYDLCEDQQENRNMGGRMSRKLLALISSSTITIWTFVPLLMRAQAQQASPPPISTGIAIGQKILHFV
jgi:hypothetical protein